MLQRRARVRLRAPITHLTRAPAARRTAGKPSGSRAGTRRQPPRAAGATSCCRKLGAPASPAFPPSCRQAGPLRPAPTSPEPLQAAGHKRTGCRAAPGSEETPGTSRLLGEGVTGVTWLPRARRLAARVGIDRGRRRQGKGGPERRYPHPHPGFDPLPPSPRAFGETDLGPRLSLTAKLFLRPRFPLLSRPAQHRRGRPSTSFWIPKSLKVLALCAQSG